MGRRWCFRRCFFSNCFKSTVKSIGYHREGVESSGNATYIFLGDVRRGVDAAGSKAFEMVTDMAEGVTCDYWALMICEVRFLAFGGAGVVCEVFLFTLRGVWALMVCEMFFFAFGTSVFREMGFKARRWDRALMVVHMLTSAGCIARFARKGAENLSLILLCAAYLWGDMAVLDKRTSSVKAEG